LPSQVQVISGLRNTTSFPSGFHAAAWARQLANLPVNRVSSLVPFVIRRVDRGCPSTVAVAVYAIQSRFTSSFTGFHAGSVAAPLAGLVTRVPVPPARFRT
jgi:hypothetical protein